MFTFCASGFDVGSDIVNSFSFLGVLSFPRRHDDTSHCETRNQGKDLMWGILSLGMVFLPGFIYSLTFCVETFYRATWCGRCLILFGMILFTPICSVGFPFVFLSLQLKAIINTFRNIKIDQEDQLRITQFTGFEAAIESTLQLILQLFIIFIGYPSSILQKVTVAASLFQIARCSVLNDIETKIGMMKINELSIKESLKETIYRLPLYASTIIFRVGSIVLTTAYLRLFALIPIAILFVTQTTITWMRYKKLDDKGFALKLTLQLVVSNIGVVNAIGILNTTKKQPPWRSVLQLVTYPLGIDVLEKLDEKEEDVVRFIRNSSLATFIHHSAILILIMIVGHLVPNAMDNWSSECDLLLKPGTQAFFWLFGVVLFMGFYSVTAIMYGAPMMVNVNTNTPRYVDSAVQFLSKNLSRSFLPR